VVRFFNSCVQLNKERRHDDLDSNIKREPMKRSIVTAVMAVVWISFGTGCSSSGEVSALNTAGFSMHTRSATETPKREEPWTSYNPKFRGYEISKYAADFMDQEPAGIKTHSLLSSPYHKSECRIISIKRICVEINDATKTWLAGLEFHF
jgi:hypothetical protein